MLSDILSSVHWGHLGATAGFMAVVLMAHFLWARPSQRKAQAELRKCRLDLQTAELAASISSITSGLLLASGNSEQLAVHAAKLQAAMHRVSGHPALLQAMQELLDATAKLAAANQADKHALDSNTLQVASACLTVEQRLAALTGAAITAAA